MAPRKNAKQRVDPLDKLVGGRVRQRRKDLGMSQTALGNAIGLTFQQVQKYENGINRVSASRLQQISGVLKVEPSYFFEPSRLRNDASLKEVEDFIASKDGTDLMRAMGNIKHKETRAQIARLVEVLALAQDTSYTPLRRRGKK